MWRFLIFLMLALTASGQEAHPVLALGSPAPNFELPGVDGAIHKLVDYSSSPILVVVFTCNHCPIAQMYERRITQLASDYKDRGVAVVAIQPNDPKAITIDELDSSDISDSLDEMKMRAQYKHLTYPYLYDGETQSVADAYGPQATPHVFVFDRDRRLRYEGHMDDSYRAELVKTHEARDAIDALRRAVRSSAENRVSTGSTGDGLGCEPKDVADESNPQSVAGEFLGNMVWLMHTRIPRFPGHFPNVWRARFGVGHGSGQHAGRKEHSVAGS